MRTAAVRANTHAELYAPPCFGMFPVPAGMRWYQAERGEARDTQGLSRLWRDGAQAEPVAARSRSEAP